MYQWLGSQLFLISLFKECHWKEELPSCWSCLTICLRDWCPSTSFSSVSVLIMCSGFQTFSIIPVLIKPFTKASWRIELFWCFSENRFLNSKVTFVCLLNEYVLANQSFWMAVVSILSCLLHQCVFNLFLSLRLAFVLWTVKVLYLMRPSILNRASRMSVPTGVTMSKSFYCLPELHSLRLKSGSNYSALLTSQGSGNEDCRWAVHPL